MSPRDAIIASPRINHVLIDYENVQPTDLRLLDRDDIRVRVFIGANQKSVSTALVTQLQPMGPRAQYLRCSGNGSNALDFHIAYYIGRLAREDPLGYFHIISKDTGFDPLIAHLREQGITCHRSSDIACMTLFKSKVKTQMPETTAEATAARETPTTPAQRLQRIRQTLAKMGSKRPVKLASLKNHINAQFQNTLKPSELDALLVALQKSGVLTAEGAKAAYL